MANKKFSEFVLKTSTSEISHIVGYTASENVQITPANFVTTGGTGVFLPLAGGTMTGTNGVVFPDNFYLNLGTSSDFEIYHDGNNSYLKDQGTGELILASNGTGIKLEKTSGEKMIHALTDGAVELYYDSVKKFETTSLGATVTGDLLVTGTITGTGGSFLPLAGGTLTGALTGTSATFVGNVTVSASNSLLIRDDGSFIKEDQGLQIGNTSVTGATRPIRFFTESVERLTIDSSGNSTFAGNVGLGVSPTAISTYRVLELNGSSNNGGYIGLKSDGTLQAEIYSSNGGLFMSSIISAPLIFKTNNTEKMRLDASGNLGLGTSTPSEKFQVNGNISTKGFSTNTGYDNYLKLYGNNIPTTNPHRWAGLAVYNKGGNNNNELAFFTGSGDVARTEKMLIDVNGNLGLGTSSPFGKLSVNVTSGAPATSGNMTNALTVHNTDGGRAIQLGVDDSSGLTFINSGYVNNAGVAQPIAFYTGGSERMRILSGGEVLIAATTYGDGANNISLQEGLVKIGSATTGTTISMYFTNPNGVVGSISTTGSATAFSTSSDYRLKEDLQDFKGLELVSKIPVYDYKWKADESRSYGVMAHELQEVLPDAVTGHKDAEEMQGVDYSKIVPLLVKSIQELKAEIELLKNK